MIDPPRQKIKLVLEYEPPPVPEQIRCILCEQDRDAWDFTCDAPPVCNRCLYAAGSSRLRLYRLAPGTPWTDELWFADANAVLRLITREIDDRRTRRTAAVAG